MIKRYRLPIYGSVLSRYPLKGQDDNPVNPISLYALSDIPKDLNKHLAPCLEYNIEEEWCEIELDADQKVHDWLTAKLSGLPALMVAKNLKLDISELVIKKVEVQ